MTSGGDITRTSDNPTRTYAPPGAWNSHIFALIDGRRHAEAAPFRFDDRRDVVVLGRSRHAPIDAFRIGRKAQLQAQHAHDIRPAFDEGADRRSNLLAPGTVGQVHSLRAR